MGKEGDEYGSRGDEREQILVCLHVFVCVCESGTLKKQVAAWHLDA